jgi:hypothetical protein
VNFDRSFYYKNNIKTTLKNKQHKVIGLFFLMKVLIFKWYYKNIIYII